MLLLSLRPPCPTDITDTLRWNLIRLSVLHLPPADVCFFASLALFVFSVCGCVLFCCFFFSSVHWQHPDGERGAFDSQRTVYRRLSHVPVEVMVVSFTTSKYFFLCQNTVRYALPCGTSVGMWCRTIARGKSTWKRQTRWLTELDTRRTQFCTASSISFSCACVCVVLLYDRCTCHTSKSKDTMEVRTWQFTNKHETPNSFVLRSYYCSFFFFYRTVLKVKKCCWKTIQQLLLLCAVQCKLNYNCFLFPGSEASASWWFSEISVPPFSPTGFCRDIGENNNKKEHEIL